MRRFQLKLMLLSLRDRGGRSSFASPKKGSGRTGRRTLYFPALIVAAVLMTCAAALLAVSATRERLEERGLPAEISKKGKPAPLEATQRWAVEFTNSWHNAHKKKLMWCTERCRRVNGF
jgi:hypothetical protein